MTRKSRISIPPDISNTGIAHMIRWLANKWYTHTSVFVDQASKLSCIYLYTSTTIEETLETKKAFRRYSLNRDVGIAVYHADNSIFKWNEWQHACKKQGHLLTFAGINAYFKNSLTEKRIRDTIYYLHITNICSHQAKTMHISQTMAMYHDIRKRYPQQLSKSTRLTRADIL